jgi:hypothetical protein
MITTGHNAIADVCKKAAIPNGTLIFKKKDNVKCATCDETESFIQQE